MKSNNNVIMLWDGNMPLSNGGYGFNPYLEVYPVKTQKTLGAVLVCPGGGYGSRAAHETGVIAEAYNSRGLNAFVVYYRIAPDCHPAPLQDVSRAMRIIRANADRWNVLHDKIAVCGFSAGGHLAASLGIHYEKEPGIPGDPLSMESNRPDAMILSYPVITSSSEFLQIGSSVTFNNLCGDSSELKDMMSLEKHVSEKTPQTFLWHTAEDQMVPVENSLLFAMALSREKVPYELHIYPHGLHGLGLSQNDAHVATWLDLSVEWLTGMGWK